MATLAPSSSSARATPRPNPLAPPVTSARLGSLMSAIAIHPPEGFRCPRWRDYIAGIERVSQRQLFRLEEMDSARYTTSHESAAAQVGAGLKSALRQVGQGLFSEKSEYLLTTACGGPCAT